MHTDTAGTDMPTLRDVARLAGVSRSTASAVLSSPLNTRASVKTRERVRKAADQLSYRPSAFARSLRRRGMGTIGFYSGYDHIDARNPFLSAVICGIHAQCDQHQCDLLIHRGSMRSGREELIREIIGGKVDGVILWTYPSDPVVKLVESQHFPAVAIADRLATIPSVTADDVGGTHQVARRLHDRGHKQVLYRMPLEARGSGNIRCDGFCEEARALGLNVEIGYSADWDGKLSEDEIRLLSAPAGRRPTAVACWNDTTALETLKDFQVRGWTDQFAVIGFDGFDAPGLPVTLTTVNVSWDTIAGAAVDMVHELASGASVDDHLSVPVHMIDGNTD